ncbi:MULTISPECIES: type II secretion system protein [Pseudomonas]|nr:MULTISPECIES: type II secretion system protein [Pseudomonas]MDU4254207.1 type II secretion system protein [Pseudomonas sp.]
MQTMGRTKGFTLIEIAVCIAIAAVLTAAVLPSLMQSYQHHKIFSSIEQAKNLVPICEIARTRATGTTIGANLQATHTYSALASWSKTSVLQGLLGNDYRIPAKNPLGSDILVKFDSERCYVGVDLPFKEDNYAGYLTEAAGSNTRIIITTKLAGKSTTAWVTYQKRVLQGETTR